MGIEKTSAVEPVKPRGAALSAVAIEPPPDYAARQPPGGAGPDHATSDTGSTLRTPTAAIIASKELELS